ncbi:MAG: sporulation initiation factor Spo0A C-terminal domain-containing protein [Clostridia bacterium]|nr:sporulation initiation factor Spo0A C-terminal domain-containing protein [Clostridia bacterium]
MGDDCAVSLFDMSKRERERKIMQDRDLHDSLRLLLIRLGMAPRLLGYDYVMCAIKLSVANRDYLKHITTKMYPVIAMYFGVEPTVVERNIRHAMEVVVTSGRVKYLNEYLGTEVFSESRRPTNSEFISLVADKVSVELSRSSAFFDRDFL